MPLTNFAQGVGSFGIPQMAPHPLLINPAGAVIFVNSQTGLDNRGRISFPGSSASSVTGGSTQGPVGDPTKPVATLAYALTFTKAGRGDIVVVMAGHAETLTTNITCSTDSTIIYGCGQGSQRPIFTMGGNSIILSGIGVSIANVRCDITTVALTAGAIQLTGNSAFAYNCKVGGSEATSVAYALAAARTTLDTCEVACATTGLANGVLFSAVDEIVVRNSNIHGIFATAPVSVAAATNFLLDSNVLRQQHATVDPVITGVVTATSGTIVNNRFSSVHAATAAAFIGGANVATNVLVIYLQNYGFTGKAGPSSGILVPTAGTIP